jgi:hypothetical protein
MSLKNYQFPSNLATLAVPPCITFFTAFGFLQNNISKILMEALIPSILIIKRVHYEI